MGLTCLIRYRGSSKAQIFKEVKVQGWAWDLFCARKWGGIHTKQLRKHREIYLWTLITIKWICLNPLSTFAMAGENLLIRPSDSRGRERNPGVHLEQQSSPWLHHSLLGNQKASWKMAEAFRYTTVLLSKPGMSSAHHTGAMRYQVFQKSCSVSHS